MDQYLENDDIIKIGPFVFRDNSQWRDCKDFQVDSCYEDQRDYKVTKTEEKEKSERRMTKKQFSYFSAKYKSYKTNLSTLKLIQTEIKLAYSFPKTFYNFCFNIRENINSNNYSNLTFQTIHQINTSKTIINQNSSITEFYVSLIFAIQLSQNSKETILLHYKLSFQLATSSKVFQNLIYNPIKLHLQNLLINVSQHSFNGLNWTLITSQIQAFLKEPSCSIFSQQKRVKNQFISFLEYNQISNFMSIYKCKFPLLDTFSKSIFICGYQEHNILSQNLDRRLNHQLLKNKFTKLKN